MLQPNKDELSRMNNQIVYANERIERARAEMDAALKLRATAEAWIQSHMETVYPEGGQVALPKEGGRGAVVIVRRLHDEAEGHYIVERLSCD